MTKVLPSDLETGEFITIPAWNVEGMVIGIEPVNIGPDDSRTIILETYPGEQKPKSYRLSPGEFKLGLAR
jgi:hypothetical protein